MPTVGTTNIAEAYQCRAQANTVMALGKLSPRLSLRAGPEEDPALVPRSSPPRPHGGVRCGT